LISIKDPRRCPVDAAAMSWRAPLTDIASPDRDPPRYATYPTAARFGPAIGPAQADAWLRALPAGSRVSVHVHVPFCEKLCWFCSCRTQGATTVAPVLDYLEALEAEIDRVGSLLPEGVEIGAVSWGGGSPTILPPEAMRRLDAHLRAALPIAADAGFAVEIEPHGLPMEKLAALRDCQLSGARIGLQDFDPRIGRAIGRTLEFERVAGAFEALRATGVGRIDVDLLYGLPLQGASELAATCDAAAALGPERLSIGEYAHVPWMAKRQRMIPEASLPDAEERAAQLAIGAARIEAAGYARVGVDQFVRPGDALAVAATDGRLRRGLGGYAERLPDAVIGIGAAALSQFPQGYVQNAAETGVYADLVRRGCSAAARGAALSLEDRVRARAIEMIFCDLGVDLGRLRSEFGDFARMVESACAAALERFDGMVAATAAGIALRVREPMLARSVARLFDAAALPGPEARPA
jgi:oxygen-independent coproporphyrinogen-3 oxidase